MPDWTHARDAYDVLGVASTATDAELKRAYRRLVRQTHPDLGGETTSFHLVSEAWLVLGEPGSRARYDASRAAGGPRTTEHAARTAPASSPARPARHAASSETKARAYGHPGGADRERYLALLREWLDVPSLPPNPFAPDLLRSVPRDLKELYLKARSEERTAVVLAGLDAGYTYWNDLAVIGRSGSIDHVLLGPTGLFAIFSTTWDPPVLVRRGELSAEGIRRGDRPAKDVLRLVKGFEKQANVHAGAIAFVVADDPDIAQETELVRSRPVPTFVVPRSRLGGFIRSSADGTASDVTASELFEARERIGRAVLYT
jgi:hypothetical protein